jgi:formate hydrogenlyase transcriptional activator
MVGPPAGAEVSWPVRITDALPAAGDAAIREAQRCIVEALDLDGSTLFERTDDGDLLGIQSWWRPGIPGPPARVSARDHFPWMLARLLAGELVCVSGPDDLLEGVDRASLCRFGVKSTVVIPLGRAQRVVGAMGFDVTRGARRWTPEIVQRLRLAASLFATVLVRRPGDEAPLRALADVERLSGRLSADSAGLRTEVESTLATSGAVGPSAAIRRVQEQVRQVADTDATVLLLGETGSGKEVFASQIHELSRRRSRAMVRVNCAAIPATLIESELFGREKGAYTGALSRQIGRFELADNSTIFLDEIGDLPLDVQVKFLRVLEERQIERLGSSKVTKIDTRIIAATHRDLEKRIEADQFREDLYYRLNVFPIRVPPLRERIEDIPMLVWRFVEDFSAAAGKRVESIAKDNIEMLQRYHWPGNVRELRNLVERAVICATGPRLTIAVPQSTAAGAATRRSVRLFDVEKEHIKGVLESTRWRIRGIGGAADQLGLKATTLETRMAKLGLQRPRH